jgi:FkbM family methyltransferase
VQQRPAVFVLAACDDGPMLVARTDAQRQGAGHVGVGISLLETGAHAQDEIDALLKLSSLRRHHRPGQGFMVLDVGANVGAHTVPWAKYMTGWGELIAIEAQERLFGALWGNITINNLFNARAIWAAASDQCGLMPGPTMDYRRPANFGGVSMLERYNGGQPVENYAQVVPMLTIDSLNLRRLDVLKIDVEGMEPAVLNGADKTIARDHPLICAEHTTCGRDAIVRELPVDYRSVTAGMNLLCMHRDDPLWQSVSGGQPHERAGREAVRAGDPAHPRQGLGCRAAHLD